MFKFQKKKKTLTRVIVQFDTGFPNSLFLRGEGIPGLNWEKGVELKNLKPDSVSSNHSSRNSVTRALKRL